jgi:hypothetical protein
VTHRDVDEKSSPECSSGPVTALLCCPAFQFYVALVYKSSRADHDAQAIQVVYLTFVSFAKVVIVNKTLTSAIRDQGQMDHESRDYHKT